MENNTSMSLVLSCWQGNCCFILKEQHYHVYLISTEQLWLSLSSVRNLHSVLKGKAYLATLWYRFVYLLMASCLFIWFWAKAVHWISMFIAKNDNMNAAKWNYDLWTRQVNHNDTKSSGKLWWTQLSKPSLTVCRNIKQLLSYVKITEKCIQLTVGPALCHVSCVRTLKCGGMTWVLKLTPKMSRFRSQKVTSKSPDCERRESWHTSSEPRAYYVKEGTEAEG